MYTYLILGHAYSLTESLSLTFKINNSTVFSGDVPAAPLPEPDRDTVLTELFRFTTDILLEGELSVSGTVSGGDLFFALFAKSILTQLPDETEQEIIIELEYPDNQLNNHAVTNLTIDGVVQQEPINIDKPEAHSDIRGWHYRLPDGCEFGFKYFTGPFESAD
jgi:hypothetical protein